MASHKNQDIEMSEDELQEVEDIEFNALPLLVGVRGKVSKTLYRDLTSAARKSGVDQGVFIEAGLRLFNNLPKEEKVKLLALINAERMSDSF